MEMTYFSEERSEFLARWRDEAPDTFHKSARRVDAKRRYWEHGSRASVSPEGFNNNVGEWTRQACGYRGEEARHLKIYDLPQLSTRRTLWVALP